MKYRKPPEGIEGLWANRKDLERRLLSSPSQRKLQAELDAPRRRAEEAWLQLTRGKEKQK
jgi:hypothetical protein